MTMFIRTMADVEAMNELGWYLTVMTPVPFGAYCWFDRINVFSMN